MKTSRVARACGLAVFAVSILMPPMASATVRFTYDGDPLPWNFSALNDSLFLDVGSTDMPDFSISFDGQDGWLHPAGTTIFTIPIPTVRLWSETRQYTMTPAGDALLMIDPDGSISGWRFGYEFSPIFTPDDNPAVVAANRSLFIFSTNSMGSSCPCDNFSIFENYIGEGPAPDVGELVINYRDTNGNHGSPWSIAAVSAVPEPANYAMLMGGLGMLGVMASRRRRESPSRRA
jgi:hypothetical protein